MKLAFAMLADSASVSTDGKLSIQGGDIDVIRSLSFPSLHPTLTLVARLVAEPSDRGKELALTIAGTMPQGETWFEATSPPIQWRKPDKLGRPAKYNFVVNLPMLVFPREGMYVIRLLLGGEELISLPLYAERIVPPDAKGKATRKGEG